MLDDSGRPSVGTPQGGTVGRGDERFTFLREFLRRPNEIGSIVPSSRFLEQRLVAIGGVEQARTVVELGPGTGGTTRALLDALRGDARLLAVEINPRFATLLESIRDRRLIVNRGSAVDLRAILARHGLARVDVVLSGIPFSTMPAALARCILHAIALSLAPGGRFVAYQLRGAVEAIGRDVLGVPEVQVVLRNVPPMRIYTWRKPSAP